MNQEHAVEGLRRQHRVIRRAQFYRHILQVFALDPVAQCVAHARHDILGQHAPLGTHRRRQPDRVIALPCTDVGDGHAGLHLRKFHHLLGLADTIARIFGREGIADDGCDIALGGREARLGRLSPAGGEGHREHDDGTVTPHPRPRPSRRSPAATMRRP